MIGPVELVLTLVQVEVRGAQHLAPAQVANQVEK